MVFLLLVLGMLRVSSDTSIPLAYSTELGVTLNRLQSVYIQPVEIRLEEFSYPPHSQKIYRAAIGNFSPYFGLNTTAESVAYFITGTGPPNGLNAQNWLQMEPRLVSLSPVAQIFAKDNSEIEEYVFITDSTQDCYDLRENVSSNFKWSILGSDNSTEMLVEVTRLKPHIENLKVHFAICDAGKELQFSKMTLDLLLKTGLYSGSEAYIYTYASMTNTTNYEMMKAFADAGAYLATVTPALSSSNMDAVELTKKYLVALAQNYVRGSDLLLNGKIIPFTSANFLRLIQATPYNISNGNMDIQISFSEEGASRVVNFYFCEFPSSSTITCTSGYYYHTGKELKLDIELNEKQKVKLLAFQDMTFLPSYANTETSKAILMVQQIFTSNLPYSYELVNATFDKTKTIQETIVKTLKNSETTYTMSAFPILLDSDLGVPQSSTVFYDGIVMIKIRKATTVNLFHIFDAISGLIWLCVFASLIFVALIFFIIKVANDYRTRQLGLVPEDQDIPLLRQFFNVIYQNFSAVLLAKVLVKPKQTSIKVLYQSYWIASILFVATYAAALADQRFGTQATSVPFDSLRGLAYNTGGYKWFFLRNSSVVWKMKNSKDSVLNKLMSEAESKWASKMYVESVADAVSRIEGDSHQILIASRLEVKRILSEECQLTKVVPAVGTSGLVEYLYGVGYQFSGPNAFVTTMSERIDSLISGGTFESIEKRTLGLGDCPLDSESLNMQRSPYNLRDFGGIFIILLVGIIVAFIVVGIEFLIEKYPMYRQRQQATKREFGKTYAAEVINVMQNGILIRVPDTGDLAFVDLNHIRGTTNAEDRLNIQDGVYVKATYMGNDPHTAAPLYNVQEERVFQPQSGEVVPPNNQPMDQE